VFHSSVNFQTLHIIVPIGISFFTFRTLSYILDIDKGKIKPTTDWVIFFNYVAFFPSILSGPIDKANSFVPQLSQQRVFDYDKAVDSLRQILWGLFKKMVIADNCAIVTDEIFVQHESLPGSTLLFGAFLYTFQIYADFSGYSDMAIGVARLLGIKIARNFEYPLFAQNIAEFWRKWHISLTSWLTEYVFTPLSISFRDYDKIGLMMAVIVNFTIIGFWHGANWTYILFGFIHGCFFIPLIYSETINKKKKITAGQMLPKWNELLNMFITITMVTLTFILFKSETLTSALGYYKNLFSTTLLTTPTLKSGIISTLDTIVFIILMSIVEWFGRDKQFAISTLNQYWTRTIRWALYAGLIFIIIVFTGEEQKFIYFQF
jgi:D-alanyl-lipoteichoic acid acyltransferase DltB (MBOAT superfamily)